MCLILAPGPPRCVVNRTRSSSSGAATARQPAYEQFMSGFRPVLNAQAGTRPELFTEFLDSSRFPQAEHSMRMREFLRGKYAATRIDLVISTSPFALDFIVQHRAALFPERACRLRARFDRRIPAPAAALGPDRHPGSIRPGQDPGHGAAPAATREPRGHRDRGGRVRQDVGGHRPARGARERHRPPVRPSLGSAVASTARAGGTSAPRYDRPVPLRAAGRRRARHSGRPTLPGRWPPRPARPCIRYSRATSDSEWSAAT